MLILAANTSFQGFPRLSALLARDRFIARQFTNLGDRLVYSNGVVVLAGAAALLVWIYHANVNNLIHLYVVGVFTAFTLSQAGMVRYWLRTHGPGWRWRAVINGIGAAGDLRRDGRRRRDEVPGGRLDGDRRDPADDRRLLRRPPSLRRTARRLAAGAAAVVAAPPARNIDASSSSRRSTTRPTARSGSRATISGGDYRAVHVPRSSTDSGIRPRWFKRVGGEPQLEILDRSLGVSDAMLDQVWRLPRGESDFVTVVVPE